METVVDRSAIAYDGDGKTIRDTWAVTDTDSPDRFIEKPTFVSAVRVLQDDWEAFETAVVSRPDLLAQAVVAAEDFGRLICDSPLWLLGSEEYAPYMKQSVSAGQLTFYVLVPLSRAVDYAPGVWQYSLALQDMAVTSSKMVDSI